MFGASYRASDELNYVTWIERAQVSMTFCVMPRRCYSSGKWLWLRRAVRATRMYTGPGDPVFEHRWYDPQHFLMHELRRIQ